MKSNINWHNIVELYANKYSFMEKKTKLAECVKALRKQYGMTQEDLAYKSGVSLFFVREMEQGKVSLRMDKVNQVLKYKSSYEQVAKVIAHYSATPILDVMRYYELLLFCWITGNNDMHLKNFSLYCPTETGHILTPAYDLLNVVIVNPKDTEELALTLNGKKRKLTRADFEKAMLGCGMNEKVVSNIFRKFEKIYPAWESTIRSSFLPQEMQDRYWNLVQERMQRIGTRS